MMSNTSEPNMSILVADFGEAFLTHGTMSRSSNNNANGTLVYMAPERFGRVSDDDDDDEQQHRTAVNKSDLWSCGVIIYQMIHLELPFRDLKEILNKKQLNFDSTLNISNELKPLLIE